MGFRISYLLAQTDAESASTALNLTLGAAVGTPPFGEPLWSVHLLKTGWTVIWAEDELFFFDRPRLVAALSRKAPVLTCIANETVMASAAMGWRNGREAWSVHHQGDGDDPLHLNAQGAPPPLLDDLRARAAAHSDDDSDEFYSAFEIPLDLVAMETGFRHDRALSAAEAPACRILSMSKPRKPGLIARLMGRG